MGVGGACETSEEVPSGGEVEVREEGRVDEERAGGWEEEDMMGLPGWTGETAIESGVGEEEAWVGVEGELPPPF